MDARTVSMENITDLQGGHDAVVPASGALGRALVPFGCALQEERGRQASEHGGMLRHESGGHVHTAGQTHRNCRRDITGEPSRRTDRRLHVYLRCTPRAISRARAPVRHRADRRVARPPAPPPTPQSPTPRSATHRYPVQHEHTHTHSISRSSVIFVLFIIYVYTTIIIFCSFLFLQYSYTLTHMHRHSHTLIRTKSHIHSHARTRTVLKVYMIISGDCAQYIYFNEYM